MDTYNYVHIQSCTSAMLVTSPGLLEIVTPFSLGMLLELLLGELGPEPGALLHADSRIHTKQIFFFNLLAWANHLSGAEM